MADAVRYPLNRFPEIAGQTGQEMTEFIQAPDALIGPIILSTLSTCIQPLADVRLPTGQVRPVLVNTSIIADSGERKTAVESLLSAPLHDRDEANIKQHEADMKQYNVDLQYWKGKGAAINGKIRKLALKGQPTDHLRDELKAHADEKPARPRLRRMMWLNASARAIMDALDGEGESIAFISDEGHALLKGGAFQQIGLLNKAWDGARSLPLDRANGEMVIARHPRVTIALMVQEAVFFGFLKRHGEEMRGSGHWARYLVAWPESTQGTRFIHQLTRQWKWLPKFTERITQILQEQDTLLKKGKITRKILEFSPEVDDRWIYLSNIIEEMIQPNDFYHEIRDASSKAMEMVGRIAALFHYFSGEEGDIPLATVNRAVDIVRWHLDEFKRIFSGEYHLRKAQDLGEKLAAYLQRQYADRGQMEIEKNEILHNRVLGNRDELNEALQYLTEQGRVQVFTQTRYANSYSEHNSRFSSGRKYGTRYIRLMAYAFPQAQGAMLGSTYT